MDQTAELSITLLGAFIPGFGTISRFLFGNISFLTLLVFVSPLLFGLIKAVEFVRKQCGQLVTRFGTCSVSMTTDVDSYTWIMEWLWDQGIGIDSHRLIIDQTTIPVCRELIGVFRVELEKLRLFDMSHHWIYRSVFGTKIDYFSGTVRENGRVSQTVMRGIAIESRRRSTVLAARLLPSKML